ncbi:nuclear hormone receptor HR96 isoform X1 [Bombus vancouverensis nearcticus]|uniref:Nuclear hormone receptor HR96 n=2 Tax=Pyrobombus TaxID=144703 RepID=A0A6P8M214_9HYME|nr:nuclear hormone receptor HR96 [Bombus vancouverensis nearcticus]XP_033304779.1 nuclear hormone receptor HR96 [Bombus bifarius]
MEDEQPARETNKICGVCGDRALGYNFNAVSCESCKAFFRRNALKNKDFRCPFTENCNITPVTRRFCQKCRLDKCFSIGMRKEYIMSEEDKVLKRQKIEQNRAKKRPTLESAKPSKIKKGYLDECNFDDTSMSVNSVVSTASDTYFWESDRKYTDLDANRQNVTESLSPVTAASVPSPSSPPENGAISGSKTLDMMKDSTHNSNSNFENYDHTSSPRGEENDVDAERLRMDFNSPSENQQRLDKVKSPSHNLEKSKKSVIGLRKSDQNISDLNSEFASTNNESMKYSPEFENASCYNKFDCSPVQSSQYIEHTSHYRKMSIDMNSGMHTSVQNSEEVVLNQKQSKETCSEEDNFISNKFSQDSTLITKLVNNSNFITKIFQNEELLIKIMSDPVVISKLEADPQISHFFKKTGVVTDKEAPSEKEASTQYKDDVKPGNNNSSHTFKPILKVKQKQVENPILTDLITNSSQEECIKQRDNSSDWNRNLSDVTRDVLQDVQRVPIAVNSIESILCEAIKLEFSTYSALGGMETRRVLNDAERAKLNELIVANKALLAPLDEDITNLIGEDCKFKNNFGRSDPALLDVINLTAIAIRRLIKMAKKINAFKNMCQEDQIALLKGGSTEMMILRSALNYDVEKDMWWIPHSQESMSNIKVDVLKEAKGNLYTEHSRFIRSFDPRWRDENIILILSAIALFTPDRPKVVHNDVIKLEQNSYYYLLRRYLESVYPGCEAKSMFLKLIQKISDLHRLNNEVVGVYLNLNPSSVEPLLIEIFDLKH